VHAQYKESFRTIFEIRSEENKEQAGRQVKRMAYFLAWTVSGVRRKFSWGVLVQGHMVVICIWCALFVTSQFDFISMFPNQRFGEVC